jgi:4-carboxymuconolactone decarboxylase
LCRTNRGLGHGSYVGHVRRFLKIRNFQHPSPTCFRSSEITSRAIRSPSNISRWHLIVFSAASVVYHPCVPYLLPVSIAVSCDQRRMKKRFTRLLESPRFIIILQLVGAYFTYTQGQMILFTLFLLAGFLVLNIESFFQSSSSSDCARTTRHASHKPWEPTSRDFVPRYTGPPDDELSKQQIEIRDAILATRKGTGLRGPFGPWLSAPDIAQPAQALGRACRYGTSLSFRESELVILLTGSKLKSHAEFDIHVGEALKAGISMNVINAIPRDDDFCIEAVHQELLPLLETDREIMICKFTTELLCTYKVTDDMYATTKAAVGNKDSVLVEISVRIKQLPAS